MSTWTAHSALVLALVLSAASGAAQSDATALEEETIAAFASYRAVRAQRGESDESTRERASALRASVEALDRALGAGARIDRAAVVAYLEAELDAVLARLSEVGARCGGPAAEVAGAEARRDALREALAGLDASGRFVPELEGPRD